MLVEVCVCLFGGYFVFRFGVVCVCCLFVCELNVTLLSFKL